ncbi:hypothetical protein BDV26DRAFT_265211 [Aspergillus bertholletiae]|uniref:Uncharacterized protein n=1 Tax=Aspergillus bertholletiae TaxID=1226010 RepID=A0A5N7B602_9EURO|nr:hypothetical protein BDV26DRAFT_265211 [Aspergillus bertholletiae]
MGASTKLSDRFCGHVLVGYQLCIGYSNTGAKVKRLSVLQSCVRDVLASVGIIAHCLTDWQPGK